MHEDPPRLPPGQRVIEHMPALHVGQVPSFDPARWDLRIEGVVEAPRTLSYTEVRALPSRVSTSDFHCVEGWSVLNCAWRGVLVSTLCDLVTPRPEAHFVTIGCDGDYTTSLSVEDVLRPDVLLAWGLNGDELDPAHGFPLRLVVPHKYVYKAAKWVRWLRFTQEKELGYWEARGYHDHADPWKEQRRAWRVERGA